MDGNPIIMIINEVYREASAECYDFDMNEGMRIFYDMLVKRFSKVNVKVKKRGDSYDDRRYLET